MVHSGFSWFIVLFNISGLDIFRINVYYFHSRPITLPSASILGSLIKDTTSSTPKTTSSSKRKETPNTKGKFAEKLKERRSWFSVSPKKDPDVCVLDSCKF